MPSNSRDRAFARLCARWLDQVLHNSHAMPLARWLERENVEAVESLDLYQEYDKSSAERHRRQRLILAWMQDEPTGRLH
jgi:hypothetical protein